jgi:hypothetical protein
MDLPCTDSELHRMGFSVSKTRTLFRNTMNIVNEFEMEKLLKKQIKCSLCHGRGIKYKVSILYID